MKRNKIIFFIIFICLFWFTGCQSESSLKPLTIEEIYPSSLSDVSKIQVRHGNGELKTITDKVFIDEWINSIKDIPFEPDDKQESIFGYLYSVNLLENQDVKLSFSTTEIDGIYYIPDDQVIELMESLFYANK